LRAKKQGGEEIFLLRLVFYLLLFNRCFPIIFSQKFQNFKINFIGVHPDDGVQSAFDDETAVFD